MEETTIETVEKNELSNTRAMKRQRFDISAEDRLSDLPDDIILEIFSSLTTENTIATSVLSKRWKGLWKEMRSLEFDNKLHQSNFSDHVITALMSYQHTRLQDLTIGFKDKCDPMDLTIWLSIAFVKHVSKLVLRLNNFSEGIFFPDGVLRRNNTLKVLKLMGRMYFNLYPSSVSLHCLKELHLHHVRFQNEHSVAHLLNGCSVLETLVLVIHINSGIANITINVPSLLKLCLGVQNGAEENFAIQTPNLQSLDIKNFEGVGSFMIENAPKLTKAKICHFNEDIIENILDSIPSVENIALSAPLTYGIRKIYTGLKILEIDTKDDEWCNLLTYMLICSPNLEILKIAGGWYRFWGAKWTRPVYSPSSLMSCLHTLQWKEYFCDEADDMEIAIFILKNAYKLRNATFTVFKPSNPVELWSRNQKLRKLSNVAKASPKCNVVFEDYARSKYHKNIAEDLDVLKFSP